MTEQQASQKRPSLWKRLRHGQWLSSGYYKRNLTGVVIIVALFLIFIAFKFDVQMKIAEIILLNDQLANAKTNMVSASAEYGSRIRESELTERLDTLHLYLKVAEQPPYYLDEQSNNSNGEKEEK